MIKAIKASKLNPEKQVMASQGKATEFYQNKKYKLSSNNTSYTSGSMVDYLKTLRSKYPIFSIEDGLVEDDWNGWTHLSEQLCNNTFIGDDLFVTNKNRLVKGIELKAANSILIKLNQIGTLTETLDTINLAKRNNYHTIISHRSGETEDNFGLDLCNLI